MPRSSCWAVGCFFFNDTATTEIYTLSLHDALPILSAPGYEADDLIATLATQAAAEDMDVLIVTGDRDVLQLVSDRVTALMTRRGITEMTRFTPETVTEKYGLDRKSTRLKSRHSQISHAGFCLH